MKEIIFTDKVIQKENRVKIPNVVIDSLGLKEGSSIIIILDTEQEYIIIKKGKKK